MEQVAWFVSGTSWGPELCRFRTRRRRARTNRTITAGFDNTPESS